jgi:deazaflavin-dependent oxidoreductase (nitroreductase family)
MAKTSMLHRLPAGILSSALHPLLSRRRLVLTFTGRRSGTRYATPVNYLQRGDELLIATDSRWWRNLQGGSEVEVQLRGRRISAVADVVLEPDVVAEGLAALVRDHPPYGRWAHVKVGADGAPDEADVRAEVARGRVLIRVQLPEKVITP